jgi:hypothetical protein
LLREVAEMIRQTVTCDVCGVHKFEANHWFMAVEQKGTLKISSWGGLNSMRPSMKHLCGQKCVHRFVDDFLAGHPGSGIAPEVTLQAGDNTPAGETVDSPKIAVVEEPDK